MSEQHNKPFHSLGEILASLSGPKGLPFDLKDAEIWQVWEEVVGPVIASNARPSLIRNGVLTIGVRQPIWLQELKFMAEDIRGKLNERLGREAVRDIRFKLISVQGRGK